MELVPRQVKTALTVLASQKFTPRIISMLLPTTLREIERLGKTCVTYANATHVNFVTVMNLIGEVISMTETAGKSFIGRRSATQPAVSLSSGQTLTFAKLFSDALNKAVPGIKKIIDINNETQSESKNPIKELEAYKITFETFLSSVAAGKAGQLKEQASESIRK
ncbi:unnamed protein product, partial [Rotaria socialis]